MSLPDLRDLLARHFNQEELRQLCFDLGIEYEDLRGDTRRALIRALELTLSKRERHVPKKHGISPM